MRESEPFRRLLVTAEQMRELDRMATEKYGIPSLILMENAGRAVAEVAEDMLEDVRDKNIVVVCGPGNNGGDGFVAARHLHNAGADVKIAYFGDRAKAKGDALVNIEIAEKMGLAIDRTYSTRRLKAAIRSCDLAIDALLGTGIKGALKPEVAEVIGCLNDSDAPVLAVDLPSGIDADTGLTLGPPFSSGRVFEEAVDADVTVTFGCPKIGLLTHPAAEYVGRLIVADIGIPREAFALSGSRVYALTGLPLLPLLVTRCASAHKGDFGHLAIVAGSVGMTGAATLAAEGALRVGTGLVTLAVPESLNDIMEVKLTEAMTIPVPQGKARAFGMESLPRVLEIIEKRDAVVIGPGFGRDDDTIRFTLELIARLEKPAVIDADALFAISRDVSVLKKCNSQLILTPHPGEMANLLGTTVSEVQSNRLETARAFAKEHVVTVVLKGAGTVIAEPDGEAYINTTGTPGMATGGVGDVLSGMIGGILAQSESIPPVFAACSAVYLHGEAGEIAAEKLGESAMIASDVATAIGEAIQRYKIG
ncbi:MAG: NAD(P)H-hydrate dehydratase [Armatimonadetes bacterium]|nr:NAD(P)H-hydrate dehydratase [Armatimonadota bacterium]